MRPDYAREVRASLTDPRRLCEALGWLEGAKRQARGALIRCPSHGERNPSCSVTTAQDGTLRVKCFGCGWSGDALTMIALAYGLSLSTEFREVLATGAELAGQHALADEIRDGAARPERVQVAAPEPQPEPEYPPADEVRALWESSIPVDRDGAATRMLLRRGIDFTALAEVGMARSIHGARLPAWAAYGGRSWLQTGHTLVLPAFDAQGALRSVRAWRTTEGSDSPKRLPPRGHKASELVQANRLGVLLLRRRVCPQRLWIVEGEPDTVTAATTFAFDDAVIGIGSGSWTKEFARAVPAGTQVFVATHADEAGDRYAAHVIETLGDRCVVYRWRAAA